MESVAILHAEEMHQYLESKGVVHGTRYSKELEEGVCLIKIKRRVVRGWEWFFAKSRADERRMSSFNR